MPVIYIVSEYHFKLVFIQHLNAGRYTNSGNIGRAKTCNGGIILTKYPGLESRGDPVGVIISGPSMILYV